MALQIKLEEHADWTLMRISLPKGNHGYQVTDESDDTVFLPADLAVAIATAILRAEGKLG